MNINIQKEPTTLIKHGTKLHDDYQWMKTNKQKAVNVIKNLNKSTNKLFRANKSIQKNYRMSLRIELLKIMKQYQLVREIF